MQRLGIFYGWPSGFDGATTVDEATRRLQRYDVIVLGDGLDSPDHGDHDAALRIVAALRNLETEIFGYVPLGAEENRQPAQLAARVAAWHNTGVAGIFYDEAGADFGVTRDTQLLAARLTRDRGLTVFANAFDPDDVLDHRAHPSATHSRLDAMLGAGDAYLYESFGVRRGAPEPPADRRFKLAKLVGASARGIRIFGVTTTEGAFDESAWHRVLKLAERHRLDGMGWGEPNFAAGDNRMPWRG